MTIEKNNLVLWEAHEDIDPRFTKAITGKAYSGTSPSPQYVIKCLTDMFGPVGIGFGWRVLVEGFQPLGEKTLHWCRIEFWHTARANTFEAYGQTLAAYVTSKGGFMVDEDAPKKSMTDAIIKAASQIGVAANIFLGRWDDQKYVAEVNAEYRAAEKEAAKPSNPGPRDPVKIADGIIAALQKPATIAALEAGTAPETKTGQAWDWLGKNSPANAARVRAAYDARIAALAQTNADLGGDAIPEFSK
jgi:hypothetical protein